MSNVIVRKDRARAKSRGVGKQRGLETLESRLLMSAITTTAIAAVEPLGITVDNAGNVWVAGGDGLYKVGPDGQQVGSPAATGSSPFDVVFDPVNQHLYFSDTGNEQIVEVGLDGGVLNTYTVPNLASEAPEQLTVATDGSVWFSTAGEQTGDNSFTSEIGRLDLSGNFSFAQVPGGGAMTYAIAASPDGSVWFGAFGAPGDGDAVLAPAAIGQATAGSDGSITINPMYSVSTPDSQVSAITVAPDGSVWFGLANRGISGDPLDGPNRIVHGVLSGGTLMQTEYVIPQGASDAGDPGAGDLALDNSGRLWFSDQNNDRLSYLDTTTGDFTQMALPSTIAEPAFLVVTPTDVWGTGFSNGDNILHVDLTSFSSPIATMSPEINATVGTAYTGTLVNFTSADDGPFAYSVDYGNGQTAAGSIPFNASGVYSIAANVTYAAPGTYGTTVTITSADGNVATATNAAVATNPASNPVTGAGINLSGSQDVALAPNRTVGGQPVLAVATFTGPTAAYSATISWGDGTTTNGTIADMGGGMYAVLIASGTSQTYHTIGTFTGSVTVSGGPNDLTVGFTAAIAAAPITASTGLKLQPLLGRIVLADVANFSDPAAPNASAFTATINWGDGTSSQGLIIENPFDPGSYLVIGLHVYAKKGTYTVLTLIDEPQEDISATATATVKVN